MTSFTSRYGNPAIDDHGAHVWAHCRHNAVVVAITGRIDAANLERVTAYTLGHISAGQQLVLDLSRVVEFSEHAPALLAAVDEHCTPGPEWALVASDAVLRRLRGRSDEPQRALPLVDSVAHAERHFDDAVSARRRMVLPLLHRTA